MRWACAPGMRCISPSAPSKARRCAPSTAGKPRQPRNWASRPRYSERTTGQAVSLQNELLTLGYRVIGTVHLLQSRVDEAIAWLEKARSDIPAASIVRGHLASAYALKGETERAPAGGGTRAIARMKVVSRDVVSGVSGRLRPT